MHFFFFASNETFSSTCTSTRASFFFFLFKTSYTGLPQAVSLYMGEQLFQHDDRVQSGFSLSNSATKFIFRKRSLFFVCLCVLSHYQHSYTEGKSGSRNFRSLFQANRVSFLRAEQLYHFFSRKTSFLHFFHQKITSYKTCRHLNSSYTNQVIKTQTLLFLVSTLVWDVCFVV